MTTQKKLTIAGGVLAALLVAFLAWFFLGSSADDEVSLDDALDRAGASATDSPTTEDGTTSTALTAEQVEGEWTVEQNDAAEVNDGSFVGYRVQEELNTVGSTTATGRTPGVTGSITIEGDALVAGTLTADMTSLVSDESRRDGALRTRGIEYGTFPTATFTVTESAAFDVDALVAGESQTVSVTGELDLHGVVQTYTLDLEVQAVGTTVVVVGSLDILLSDHDIDKPVVGPVVSVADEGTLELQVFFAKA